MIKSVKKGAKIKIDEIINQIKIREKSNVCLRTMIFLLKLYVSIVA